MRSIVSVLTAVVMVVGADACNSDDNDAASDPTTETDERAADGDDEVSAGDEAAASDFGVHAELGRQPGPCPEEAQADEIEVEGAGRLAEIPWPDGATDTCVYVSRSSLTRGHVRTAFAKEGADGWTLTVTFTDEGERELEKLAAAYAGYDLLVVVDGKAWGGEGKQFIDEGLEVFGLDEDDARRLAAGIVDA